MYKKSIFVFLISFLVTSLAWAGPDPDFEYQGAYVAGDINLDGQTNILDIIITVRVIMGQMEPKNDVAAINGDINCDGTINVQDIVMGVAQLLGELSQEQQEAVDACFEDADGDGFPKRVDCSDGNDQDDDWEVNPGQMEVNGNYKDDDCNEETTDATMGPCAPQRAGPPPADVIDCMANNLFYRWDGNACSTFSSCSCFGEWGQNSRIRHCKGSQIRRKSRQNNR